MTSITRLRQLSQFLLQEKSLNLLSMFQLFQLHSQLITNGLHFHHPSAFVSLLRFYLSNPSTLSYAIHLFPLIQQPNNSTLKWNLMIRHASATNPLWALSLFQEMMKDFNENSLFYIDPFIYASLVKACSKFQAISEGKSVHCLVIRLGLDYNLNITNSLLSFYMYSMNLMSYAAVIFDAFMQKSVVTVNCMISGFVKRRNLEMGLSLFVEMLRGCLGSNVRPNYVTFVILISGCVDLGGRKTGNTLHCCCFKMGLDSNIEICNVLIHFYAKLGYIFDSANVFRNSPQKDKFSWNTMIWGYCIDGYVIEAFNMFKEMKKKRIPVDKVSFSSLISACAAFKDLNSGEAMHSHVKSVGMECEISVGTSLINMYAKCRKLEYARKVFDELPKQNIESWNTMIHVYIKEGLYIEALKLFDQIKSRNLELDEVTALGLVMACRDLGEISLGTCIHSFVETQDFLRESIILGNSLIDMYAKCGSMGRAIAVFDRISRKDVFSWTSLIWGYAINGEGKKSLAAFEQMRDQKIAPNSVTFIAILSACSHAGLIHDSRKLYGLMQEVYLIKPQIEHCGCVIDMLGRAGRIDEAQRFVEKMPMEPNALVWRMLINACSVHGHINLGLSLLSKVKELYSFHDTDVQVISSNTFAVAGKWDDVVSHRSLIVTERASKVAGKSFLSYLTE